jgi:poly(hydroxyalkanoate) depolymerase family esterase
MRRAFLIVVILASGACSNDSAAPIDQPSGESGISKHTYANPPDPQRDYYVYVPATLPAGPVPLVVFLHGCTQTAKQAYDGVRWNELADERGFIVVYPEQAAFASSPGAGTPTVDGNGGRCWNWYLDQDAHRDAGEPATIAGITREVMAAHAIDADRVYLMGISAGGAMASTMAAAYPDLYAAVSVFAGCPYRCEDTAGNLAYAEMGERARRMPMIVFQGTGDEVVNYPLGQTTVRGWLAVNDWIDDGLANDSVSQTAASRDDHGIDSSLVDNAGSPGDICAGGTLALPCPAGAVGWQDYPYSVEHYLDAQGAPLLDFWIIYGLGHNYVGGDRAGTFADPHGPGATRAAYEFFLAHPMPQQVPAT